MNVRKPLPLFKTSRNDKEIPVPLSIDGKEVRSLDNGFDKDLDIAGKLSNPIECRRLSRWFSHRSKKEIALRMAGESSTRFPFTDCLVYNDGRSVSTQTQDEFEAVLKFDGNFECGNLDRAVFVKGRNKLMLKAASEIPKKYSIPGNGDDNSDN